MKIIAVGLYGTGKTSLIYRLKHGEPSKGCVPTIGMTCEVLNQDGLELHAWDFTGRDRHRALSKINCMGSSGIIFMIDSSNSSQFNESLRFLSSILRAEHIDNATVMVVANKQDVDGAISAEVIENKIKRKCKIGPGITLFVMPMSVTSQDDPHVHLAYRLFVMTMKRKEEGKIRNGLIPRAWETAEMDIQDCDMEVDDDEDKSQTIDDDNNVIKARENKWDVNEKKKESLIQKPIHFLKSVLLY